MLLYSVRRFNLFIITLLMLTMVGFSILRLEPNSPWAIHDFWSGWMLYVGELMQLNLGVTKSGTPIIDELSIVFPATLELCFIAFVISLLVGIPVGTLAGLKQGNGIDRLSSFTSMYGYA